MADLILIDDVCDQPLSEEQRRLTKRMWAKVKRRGHWRCSPFTTTEPFVKLMGVEDAG